MENDKWKMENVLSDPYGKALLEWLATNDTGLNTRKFTGYERDATGLDYANVPWSSRSVSSTKQYIFLLLGGRSRKVF